MKKKKNIENLDEFAKEICKYRRENNIEDDRYSLFYGELPTKELIRTISEYKNFLRNDFEEDGTKETIEKIIKVLEERLDMRKKKLY
ncbi:MAG: hypothetical protein ACOX02_00310 [Acholeplasmatales bacterium]